MGFEFLHSVGGPPRVGGTLLCDVLNQRGAELGDVFASSTSDVADLTHVLQPEFGVGRYVPSYRALHDSAWEKESQLEVLRGPARGRYYDRTEQHVFDKSRTWGITWPLFKALFPGGRYVVPVRNFRDLLASIITHDLEHPVTQVQAGQHMTTRELIERMLKLDDVLGGTIRCVLEMYETCRNEMIVFRYEDWLTRPQAYMDFLYEQLGLERFVHDFSAVPYTNIDADSLLRDAYPHPKSGPNGETTRPIRQPSVDKWRGMDMAAVFNWAAERPEARAYQSMVDSIQCLPT